MFDGGNYVLQSLLLNHVIIKPGGVLATDIRMPGFLKLFVDVCVRVHVCVRACVCVCPCP